MNEPICFSCLQPITGRRWYVPKAEIEYELLHPVYGEPAPLALDDNLACGSCVALLGNDLLQQVQNLRQLSRQLGRVWRFGVKGAHDLQWRELEQVRKQAGPQVWGFWNQHYGWEDTRRRLQDEMKESGHVQA